MRTIFTGVAVLTVLFASINAIAQPEIQGAAAIQRVAADKGPVRVIVRLASPPSGVAFVGPSLVEAQDSLVKSMSDVNVAYSQPIEGLAYVVLEVDSDQLDALYESGQIEAIQEDSIERAYLAQSVPLINAPQVWNRGGRGAGRAVAVLDTGVDRNHNFFENRVVAEACYSSNSALYGATTVCPNGGTSQTGNGAGAPCAASGCNHGTHVAGIAAGENPSIAGVAPDAPIIAIQVFSQFTDQPGNPNRQNCVNSGLASPCALTFRSDQIRGLQQVLTLSSTTQIAAVNMSLGGGRNTTACDTDLRKPLIDQLRTAGIVTVIASGNDGFTDAVGAPGCISTAVTVGSTTKQDNISGFSNSAMLVDLLAPGSSINSSVPGNGFAQMSGTSMATPHVAGAFAALETAVTNKTLDEIQASLIAEGRSINDGRNNVTKPRIDLDATLNDLTPTLLQISLVNLDPAKRLRDGATTTVRATVTQGGNPVVGRVVNFSSSNTSRATVVPASPTNASGVAEATVTSHTSWSRSTVTITATVDAVSDTAPVKVPDLSTVGFALLLLVLLVAGLLRRRGRAV